MGTKKLTQEQKAQIYCVKHGHAPYIYKFWGYVHCGRCGEQIGDTLVSMFPCDKRAVIGCPDKPCSTCDPIVKKLNKMDKEIYRRLSKWEGLHDHEKILRGIVIK